MPRYRLRGYSLSEYYLMVVIALLDSKSKSSCLQPIPAAVVLTYEFISLPPVLKSLLTSVLLQHLQEFLRRPHLQHYPATGKITLTIQPFKAFTYSFRGAIPISVLGGPKSQTTIRMPLRVHSAYTPDDLFMTLRLRLFIIVAENAKI